MIFDLTGGHDTFVRNLFTAVKLCTLLIKPNEDGFWGTSNIDLSLTQNPYEY